MKSKFADARKIMSKMLKKDKELYRGYLANIAMIIYDDQKLFNRRNLNEVKGCNEMAIKLIELIFYSR